MILRVFQRQYSHLKIVFFYYLEILKRETNEPSLKILSAAIDDNASNIDNANE